jgi:hypothetical protein
LVLAGQIDEASEAHQRANQQISLETHLAQERLSTEYALEKSRLKQRHAHEKQVFEDARSVEKLLLESDYQRELSQVKNRATVINQRCLEVAGKKHIDSDVAPRPATLRQDNELKQGTLLPPLVPPNDRDYLNARYKEKAELARRQDEYQRQNADEILAQYQADSPGEENEEQKPGNAKNRSNGHAADTPNGGKKKKKRHRSHGSSRENLPEGIGNESGTGTTESESKESAESESKEGTESGSKEAVDSDAGAGEGEPAAEVTHIATEENLLTDQIGDVGDEMVAEVRGEEPVEMEAEV